MIRDLVTFSKPRVVRAVSLWLTACLLVVSLAACGGGDPATPPSQTASGRPDSAADSFAQGSGPLGGDWTDISGGGLTISSGAAAGGLTGQVTGDIWSASPFSSNQDSQVVVTSKQPSGAEWVGPAVRMQASGQDAYVGIYYWNHGRPELMLFLRRGGGFRQLGPSYASGRLAVGTRLELVAVGNTIAFLENGVVRIGVSDGTLAGGAPGIMAFGTAAVGHWSGGNAGFRVSTANTDAHGIRSYSVISADNGDGPQTLRVLTPTKAAAGVAHNFLIVLPVEAGQGSTFGDGLATLEALHAQNKYNLTIAEPTFAVDPWYANNPADPHLQYETFLTRDLVPWIKQNLATTGHEQVWLIGFSKSGIGGQDLILKHPGVFSLAATWDFPADMSSYDRFGADSAADYGTQANFKANYWLTKAFVQAHRASFRTANRIWIGGWGLYKTEDADFNALLTAAGIAHSTETPQYMPHRWDSGWVRLALAALFQDSRELHKS